mgnify:CR=1 FL=1
MVHSDPRIAPGQCWQIADRQLTNTVPFTIPIPYAVRLAKTEMNQYGSIVPTGRETRP